MKSWSSFAALLWLLAISGAAIAEKDQDEFPSAWASINVLEETINVSAWLLVQNRVTVPVHLLNCYENYTIPPGGNITVRLAGLSGFWLVPDSVNWDCHVGPFDLFYVAASFMGPEGFISVGFGIPSHLQDSSANATVNNGSRVAEIASASTMIATEAVAQVAQIAGANLVAGPPSAAAQARCWVASCGESQNVTRLPDTFSLTVIGQQASLLSSRPGYPSTQHRRRMSCRRRRNCLWHRDPWHHHRASRPAFQCRWWCDSTCWC